MGALQEEKLANVDLSTQIVPPALTRKDPHLKAVTARGRADRKISPVLMSLVTVLGVVGILIAQLWLNLSVSSGAYEIDELTLKQIELDRAERALNLEVNMLASPQNLAVEAANLGMVQNSRPAYLNLEKSKITGKASTDTTKLTQNLVANSALQEMNLTASGPSVKPVKEANAKAETKVKAENKAKAEPKTDVKAAKQEALKPVSAKKETPVVKEKPAVSKQNQTNVPVTWEGKLAAPQTH